jgi:putative iron-regulated protein
VLERLNVRLPLWARVSSRWGVGALLFTLISPSPAATNPPAASLPELKRAVVHNYAAMMRSAYGDSLTTAKRLSATVEAFLVTPSPETLKQCRRAWLDARAPYVQTEVARFYEGPIDKLEPLINAWPIDEHYVDYVAEDPDAGIINTTNKYPAITRELILSLNLREGEKSISTGFHVVEFLLWGQDRNPAGPGERSFLDYTPQGKNAERRRQYLRLATELLVEQLQSVADDWAENCPGNYRAQFLAMDSDRALANILKGIGALSGTEMAGERLTVPYETKEQEDEHSCFSDNTHNDIIYDALGVQNVYLGRYTRAKGVGVNDLLQRVDAAFASKLLAQIDETVNAAKSIPPPFDQAILGKNTDPGRRAIKGTITAFQAQADLIATAAKILSINLNE